jgi:M6 family metalloprotease-like protein
MALISGITTGIALAVLGDGSLAHLERSGARSWSVVRSGADGTRFVETTRRRSVTDITAHPSDPSAVVVSTRSGVEVFGAAATTPLAPVSGAATVTTSADGSVVVVTGGPLSRLWSIDPVTGDARDHAQGVVAVVDAIAHPTDAATLVLAGPAAFRRLWSLRPGLPPKAVAAVPFASRLCGLGSGDPRFAIGFADGRIELRDPANPGSAQTIATLPAPVWGLAFRGPDLVAGFGSDIDVVPVLQPRGVDLALAAEHYLASWTRVDVKPLGGVAFDDLAFVVEPSYGGLVSASRDVSFDPATPHVVMALGGTVGDFALLALDVTTGEVLGKQPFRVVDTWIGPDGPPVALVGRSDSEAPDAAWGGGDPYVPQNMNVRPRLGDWRVGVVVVETDDQPTLSAADAATMTQMLREEIFTGVVRGGVTESTRLFFAAISSNNLNLVEAGILTPVRLPNAWDTYAAPNMTTGRTLGDGLTGFSQAAVAEIVRQNRDRAASGQPLLMDLDRVDSLIFVLRSIPEDVATGFPGRHQWPFGTRPGGFQLSFVVGEDVFPFLGFEIAIPRSRTIQALTMPTTWTAISNGRTFAETVAHELGHNFGLHDAYFDAATHDAQFMSRDPGGWDLMGNEGGSPELTAAERMQLGWVPAGDVRTLSVGVAGYVDETVDLHPAGRGGPAPAGRRQAVELRIADGRNYYFEYRRRNAAALSDQTIAEDFVVVGTDYVSGDTPPTNRRPLTLIRDDVDADAGTFALNDDYEERDTSDPTYPNDFRLEVTQAGNDVARVHLRYADAKPDPAFRPWGQSTGWKSPDLRVENFRNLQDATLRDVPWEGHDNWIVATLRNNGRDTANNIEISFGVKDFTLGGGAEQSLGSVTVASLAAGAQVDVTSPNVWRPPALSNIPFLTIRPHYCVFARVTPMPDEITRDNNEAQSNHTRMISASGSPSTRETGVVKVTNPHPVEARCRVVVRQTDPISRTYLEQAWVLLQPGEERDVRFWTESMIGDPALAPRTKRLQSTSWETPNRLRLTGVADAGEGCHGVTTGGANVDVVSGRRTRFVDLSVGRGFARGRVEVEETGDGPWGSVVVSIRDDKDGPDLGVFTGEVRDGQFGFEFRGHVDGGRIAQAEFNGGYSAAPCISEWVEIER